jgi:hypothetical protein
MEFEGNLQNWVSIDDNIQQRLLELKRLRQLKTECQTRIFNHVSTNPMVGPISIPTGTLSFSNKKTMTPLSFKFIQTCLSECIPNDTQVEQLIQYIKDKREVIYTPYLKRSCK